MPTPKRRRETDIFLLRESIHRAVDAVVVGRAPMNDGMSAILATGKAVAPSRAWPDLQRIDWAPSIKPVLKLFRAEVARQPAPASLRALFFSMPELAYNPPVIEWVGMSQYRPQDSENNYVSKSINWPKRGPVDAPRLPALARAAEIVEPLLKGEFDDEGFPLFAVAMGFTALLACELVQSVKPRDILKNRKFCGIVAGPSGGEFHDLGTLTQQGWKPAPHCWYASLDPDDDDND